MGLTTNDQDPTGLERALQIPTMEARTTIRGRNASLLDVGRTALGGRVERLRLAISPVHMTNALGRQDLLLDGRGEMLQ